MTTMTAGTTIHQPAGRATRRTITSFLAGAILAGTVAVGVSVAADGSAEPATSGRHAPHVVAVQEPGCYVLRGAC